MSDVLKQINDLIAPVTQAWEDAELLQVTVEPTAQVGGYPSDSLDVIVKLRLTKAALNAEDLTKVLDLDK